ncbi:hypothetical protein HDV06_006652 [Boothiomyces sp. JEL0866]|nr:hypothetical protein HDV06_006652 [Boothiomyces sp. JEL0866]
MLQADKQYYFKQSLSASIISPLISLVFSYYAINKPHLDLFKIHLTILLLAIDFFLGIFSLYLLSKKYSQVLVTSVFVVDVLSSAFSLVALYYILDLVYDGTQLMIFVAAVAADSAICLYKLYNLVMGYAVPEAVFIYGIENVTYTNIFAVHPKGGNELFTTSIGSFINRAPLVLNICRGLVISSGNASSFEAFLSGVIPRPSMTVK